MSLFVTCPVDSVEPATAFYKALGWTLNAQMSDHNVSCFAIAPNQYVMLGSRDVYRSVGATEEMVGGPNTPSKVTVSFDLGSLAAEWLENQSHLKPSSARPLEIAWRRQVAPRWSKVRLSDVRYSSVQAWVTRLSTQRSASTVIRAYGVLAALLCWNVTVGPIEHVGVNCNESYTMHDLDSGAIDY